MAKTNTIITIGVMIFLARISQSAIFLKNGTCSAIKIFKLLPKNNNTSKNIITRINITEKTEAHILRIK